MTAKNRFRGFEKVTTNMLEKFVPKHHKPSEGEYATMDFFMLPQKGTKNSAGYDFFNPLTEKITIEPGKKALIWTNVKAYMIFDEVLLIAVRSSIGIKKGLTLCKLQTDEERFSTIDFRGVEDVQAELVLANDVGVVDSDYYENKDNEGNIGICLFNNSNKTVVIAPKEKIAQGIFTVYLPADSGDTDVERQSGIGSTN